MSLEVPAESVGTVAGAQSWRQRITYILLLLYLLFTSTHLMSNLAERSPQNVYHLLQPTLKFKNSSHMWPIPLLNLTLCGWRIHSFDRTFDPSYLCVVVCSNCSNSSKTYDRLAMHWSLACVFPKLSPLHSMRCQNEVGEQSVIHYDCSHLTRVLQKTPENSVV